MNRLGYWIGARVDDWGAGKLLAVGSIGAVLLVAIATALVFAVAAVIA